MWALGMIICVVLGFLLGFYTSTLMVMKDRREIRKIMEVSLKEYAKKKEKEVYECRYRALPPECEEEPGADPPETVDCIKMGR